MNTPSVTDWDGPVRTVSGIDRGVRRMTVGQGVRNSMSESEVRSVDPVVIHTTGEPWAAQLWNRVSELSSLPRGWDSYGALPLQRQAIVALRDLLESVGWSINSAPAVSLGTDGGLQCEWEGSDQAVILTVDGHGAVSVSHENVTSGDEWEGPLDEAQDLVKKIWHASL